MTNLSIYVAAALVHAATVLGQSSQTVNLAGIISEAAGIASAFGTPASASSTSSPTSSITSSTSASASAASSSTTAPSSTAASSSASASATGDPSPGGITPQARTIIIAASVVGGLLILGLLIGLALCCCLRRRRKHRRLASAETKEVGRNDWIHGREVGRDDWNHGDSSHHGFVSSHSDIDRQPRIPEVAQHDSAPLMSEHIEEPGHVHPAYRTHSWDGKNVNERNPFTPNPPIARKPVPHGSDGRKSHPFMAAGAGAALGAAAMHHHENKKRETRDSGNSHSGSSAYTGPLIDETDRRDNIHDPNRPPTPFGLNAFGANSKRSSRPEVIEPSIAARDNRNSQGHMIAHPTDAQRRSLSEREMAAANASLPERSPNRPSFGSRGYSINPDATPRTAYHEPNYNGNETDTSNESWQSAEAEAEATPTAAPPPPQQHAPSRPYWDDGNPYYSEPHHNADQGFTNVPLMQPDAAWSGHRNSGDDGSSWRRSYEPFRRYGADGSPRRSVGADGKPRRLRFSDLSPEEYHYNYEPTHNVGQAL